MVEAARPSLVLRRLVVASAFGLFALAVVRAQSGCGGDERAAAPVRAEPAARIESPTKVEPPPKPPPAAVDAPEPTTPPDPPKRNLAGSAGGGDTDVEEDVFLGASKSGFVVNKPRARQEQPKAQQNPAPPLQQNAQPGS